MILSHFFLRRLFACPVNCLSHRDWPLSLSDSARIVWQCIDAHLQIKAAWALTNIACGTTEHTVVVISSGAVPHLINLLSSPILDAQDNAVRALGNIALDSPMCRDYVILAGALSPLLALLSGKQQIDTLRSASWTLSNFCHGVRHHPNWDLISPALPTLAKLIHSPDDEVLINTCLAISYLSYGSNHEIQAVIEAGVVPRLIELLNHRSSSVQIPALRSVENIVYGDDLQTQIVIAAGALPALSTLLTSPEDIIRKEACRVISNITGSSPPQIQAVIDAKLIPPLIDILANSPDLKIRTEACWAISNATFGALQEPSQVRYLVQQGCIKPLCESLTTMDSETNQLVLNAIDNIRKVGELDQLAAGDGAINLYATLVEYACSGLRFSIHDALAVTVHSGLFSLTIA